MSQTSEPVVVIGGGFAGMAVAADLASLGLRPTVVEAAEAVGGSSLLSAGVAWTFSDLDEFVAAVPAGDRSRGQILTSGFEPALQRLADAGIGVSELRAGPRGRGVARRFDVAGALEHWQAAVERVGGSVECGTRAVQLERTPDHGWLVTTSTGVRRARRFAAAVVLATGGFQADPCLREEFIGPGASGLLPRTNPHSVGDGLRLGRSVGAALSDHMSAFYGHLVPRPARGMLPVDEYNRATLDFSDECLAFDETGQTLDASRGDSILNQLALRAPGRRAFLVFDATVRDGALRAPWPEFRAVCDRLGARLAEAEVPEDLASVVEAWGARLPDDWFQRLAEQMAPRAARPRWPLAVLEAVPTITLTHGGLAVDADGRVLDGSRAPIGRLYAIGADAGGLYDANYGGGLAVGLTFAPVVAAAVRDDTDIQVSQ